MAKKSTPIKPQKARKIAVDPYYWPLEYEDIDHWWALEAIRHGNGSILGRYLREVDEIDPRVRRELAKIQSDLKPHLAIAPSTSLSRYTHTTGEGLLTYFHRSRCTSCEATLWGESD
jgi:hypothetical protein